MRGLYNVCKNSMPLYPYGRTTIHTQAGPTCALYGQGRKLYSYDTTLSSIIPGKRIVSENANELLQVELTLHC